MNRTEIINAAIEENGFDSYLEIGIMHPARNFSLIKCKKKVGVDPNLEAPGIVKKTSDEFFKSNRKKFDLIFIDGDHRYEAVKKDVANAFKYLRAGGIVIMHDCYPKMKEHCLPEKPNSGATWNGEAYRVFLEYRVKKGFHAVCINTDHGVGILRKAPGQTINFPKGKLKFSDFLKNAPELLGLVEAQNLEEVI